MQAKFINKFSDQRSNFHSQLNIYHCFADERIFQLQRFITRSTIDHTEKETIILLDPRFHSHPTYDKTKPSQGLTAN